VKVKHTALFVLFGRFRFGFEKPVQDSDRFLITILLVVDAAEVVEHSNDDLPLTHRMKERRRPEDIDLGHLDSEVAAVFHSQDSALIIAVDERAIRGILILHQKVAGQANADDGATEPARYLHIDQRQSDGNAFSS